MYCYVDGKMQDTILGNPSKFAPAFVIAKEDMSYKKLADALNDKYKNKFLGIHKYTGIKKGNMLAIPDENILLKDIEYNNKRFDDAGAKDKIDLIRNHYGRTHHVSELLFVRFKKDDKVNIQEVSRDDTWLFSEILTLNKEIAIRTNDQKDNTQIYCTISILMNILVVLYLVFNKRAESVDPSSKKIGKRKKQK